MTFTGLYALFGVCVWGLLIGSLVSYLATVYATLQPCTPPCNLIHAPCRLRVGFFIG